MASASLSQLLDEAIGTPEVSVNLEALRKLLKIILGHLSLLGLQDVIPEEAAPVPGQSQPAASRPGPPQEEGGAGAGAGAGDTGEQPPEQDELQGTRSGSPVTSVAADMGQMEKTEPKESGISEEAHKEMAGIKAMQSIMGEEIQRIKEALGQTTDLCKDLRQEINEMKATQSDMGEGIRMIQEALGQGNLQDAAGHPTPAKPHTSDMDKLGQSPGTQSTTPGMQTEAPSAQSGTTGTQPCSQEGIPAMESIIRDLSELQGQMSSLQNLARDLQDEKEKIRQLQDALGNLGVAVAKCEVDGTNEIPPQLESALQEIKQEQRELREEQKITNATLKQLITADQLQERDEELLKSIQATVVRVEGDCEQLSYVTGSLRDDHRQHQKDIEALFRSLEGLEKKADKEDLLLLKVDKAALGSKVSCAHFDASMERLEDRMRELLRRVLGQEQRWQEAQQRFSDALDSKLDRLELGPFQKQLENTWARNIKDLKDELTVEIDDAAGIKQQLLVPYKCLSCDRQLNMQVPGPKLVISKFLKVQSCKGQDTSSAPLKAVLHLSKKPGVTELLGVDDHVDQGQEHRPEVAKRAQDELVDLSEQQEKINTLEDLQSSLRFAPPCLLHLPWKCTTRSDPEVLVEEEQHGEKQEAMAKTPPWECSSSSPRPPQNPPWAPVL
ncbi:Glutamine-rich protein 2 [Lonchura striata]|uniref:Glutamine-rich protein 2 n=1 Tax=Lonchura striata TaxID=40157 RepID=A0A218VAY6_9PASE|nr:Glutamine-rich protein 2 [Lonchura striata domestica]